MNTRVFDHVFIIMFENQYRSYVMENPFMHALAKQGIDMTNYFGVMHPSQTNYIASIAGELCNVTYDTMPQPFPLSQRTIVDLIEESPDGLTWKAYMDSYIKQNTPWSAKLIPKDEYPYVIKHNPFSSFKRILQNEDRWNRIDDEAGLWKDLINGTFPQYAWFTPNMWNDGHYLNGTKTDPEERAPALVDQLAIWLESFFKALRFPGPDSHLPDNTLVVVTFDEADFEKAYDAGKKYTYDGPNQVYTVLLGQNISPGTEEEGYNHYSLIKTIEKNFGLASLEKNDHKANCFRFLWGEHFSWGAPIETPVMTNGAITTVAYQGVLYFFYVGSDGNICYQIYDGDVFCEEQNIGIAVSGGMAAAVCNEELILIYQNAEQTLCVLSHTPVTGWSSAGQTLVKETVESFALTPYNEHQCLMLAYRNKRDDLYSLKLNNGQWDAKATSVRHKSDGDLTLAALGPSLYLIYKVVGCSKMGVISFNTAPYNVVDVAETPYSGPYENTTCDQWSPSAFPVAHFSHATNLVTPGEDEPVEFVYRSDGPLVCATLDGVIHLAHTSQGNPQVLSETFSISGVMTPALPVSYNLRESTTTNSGYGTLAEAGWSAQSTINAVRHDSNKAMSMTQFADKLVLTFQPEKGSQVYVCKGNYR